MINDLWYLLAENHSRANKSGEHRIMLEGYAYRRYRIGDSTICCVEPTLIKRILPQIENPPSHSCAAAAVSSYDQVFIAKLVSARRIS
jgi:hypothetical protein